MTSVPQDDQPVSTPTAQHLWESAVCLASSKARAALPHSNGRVDKAMQLVLGGAVELLDEHQARVTSQRDGESVYVVVNGSCPCRDFPNAPSGQCKHRMARGIAVRAVQIARELGDTPIAGVAAAPQPGIPQECLVPIQGRQYVTFQGLLSLAHQQGLFSLKAAFISVTADLALAKARAEFHDGRLFEECGDATPNNVGSRIKLHFARMALTRAKARCLRDALNIASVCAEELE